MRQDAQAERSGQRAKRTAAALAALGAAALGTGLAGGPRATPAAFAGAPAQVTDRVFVANRESGDVAVIDARTDRVVGRFAVGLRPHMTIALMDGRTITTGSGSDDLAVVDGRSLAPRARLAAGARGPEHASVSPDRRWLYVANVEGGAVSVVDLPAMRVVQVLSGLAHPHNIVFAEDGRKAYVAQAGAHALAVVDVRTHRVVGQIAVAEPVLVAARAGERAIEVQGVNNAVLVPGTGLLFAPDQDAGLVAVVDTRTDRVVDRIAVGREPWEPYLTPDGRRLLVPNLADQTVSVIDTATRRVVATLPGGREMTGVVVSADSRKAYLVRRGDDLVSVLDLARLAVVREIPAGKEPEVAARLADGSKVYVASSGSNDVTVIETATDKVVARVPNVGLHPWAVAAPGGYTYCH